MPFFHLIGVVELIAGIAIIRYSTSALDEIAGILLVCFGILTMTVVSAGQAIVRMLRGIRGELRFKRTGDVREIETAWQAFWRRRSGPAPVVAQPKRPEPPRVLERPAEERPAGGEADGVDLEWNAFRRRHDGFRD